MFKRTTPSPRDTPRRPHRPLHKRRKVLLALFALIVIMHFCATPAATWAIEMYQTHISPYNNHRCPHGLLLRGETCSQYGKRVIDERGLYRGLWMLRGRFDECRESPVSSRSIRR